MGHPFLETHFYIQKTYKKLLHSKKPRTYKKMWKMTFLLKKTIKQGEDKENKGRWESGMANFRFLINAVSW